METGYAHGAVGSIPLFDTIQDLSRQNGYPPESTPVRLHASLRIGRRLAGRPCQVDCFRALSA